MLLTAYTAYIACIYHRQHVSHIPHLLRTSHMLHIPHLPHVPHVTLVSKIYCSTAYTADSAYTRALVDHLPNPKNRDGASQATKTDQKKTWTIASKESVGQIVRPDLQKPIKMDRSLRLDPQKPIEIYHSLRLDPQKPIER